MYACPCCGFLTIPTRTDWDLCPVCFWEDDPSQAVDEASENGANGISLVQARANFRALGAIDEAFIHEVRPPRPEEVPS